MFKSAAIMSPHQLRNYLRSLSFAETRVKTAELGGGVDTPFEAAFSNLAHSYIRDKAPRLIDYEIGFQLVSKNEDNTKAVGVFGFKVGSQWLYVPVFFLNGDLKGHELLYIKSQDTFVPLKEDWIDYILGRKPSVLGDGVNRNLSLLGIMPPNLYQLSRSPQKFAADGSAPVAQQAPARQAPAQQPENSNPDQPPAGQPVSNPGPAVEPVSRPLGLQTTGKMAQYGHKTIARRVHKEPDPDYNGEGGHTIERVTHTENDPDSEPAETEKISMESPRLSSWFRDFLPTLSYLATTPLSQETKYASVRDLPTILKEAGEPTFGFLVEEIGQAYPSLLQTVDNLHGQDMLTSVARHLREQRKLASSHSIVKEAALVAAGDKKPAGWNGTMQPPSKGNGGVRSDGPEAWNTAAKYKRRKDGQIGRFEDLARIHGPKSPIKDKEEEEKKPKIASIIPSILGPLEALPDGIKHKVISKEMVDVDPDIVHDLSSDERQKILRERVIYTDKRDGRDVTIAYNVQTPLRLQNPDHTGIYYVLAKPDQFIKCLIIMHPCNHKRRLDFCTVIQLDGEKKYTNTHPANVFVRSELDGDAWRKWLSSKEDATSVPLQRRSKEYGGYDYKDKRCFVLVGTSGEGTVPFRAREEYTSADGGSVVYEVRFEDHEFSGRPAYLPDHGRHRHDYYMGGASGHDGEHIELTKQPGSKIRIRPGYCMVPDGYKLLQVRDEDTEDTSLHEPLRLGGLLDAQLAITAGTYPMRIVRDGNDVTVNSLRLRKEAAIQHLFYDHGLTKAAAEDLIEKARLSGSFECRVLYPDYIKACWSMTERDPQWVTVKESASDADRARLEQIKKLQATEKSQTEKKQRKEPVPDVPPSVVPPYDWRNPRSGGGVTIKRLPDEVKKKPAPAESTLVTLEKKGIDPANDMIRGAPNAPPFPEPHMGYDPMTGGNVPTMQSSEFNVKIPDMSASKTDRSIYYPFGPDSKAMQVAQQASRTGQKEVFDTAMLGSLLKVVRQDNMVDRYMGDLMKGLDRIGRILFLYYWHGEEFEDRYGKQDMPELEDGLRNAFEGVGDIVLFLKRKAIEPQMDDGRDPDLGEIASQ